VTPRRGFASDNSATIHPEVLEAIARANRGHAFGYGHDPLTEQMHERFAEQFGPEAKAFAVWGGSGANVLCLRAACRPWQAVICAQTAHMNVDECGAPEAIAGVKLVTIPTEEGKLTPEAVAPLITRLGDEHAVQPRMISISQSTELGTVYSVEETSALAELAHSHDMLLHVDGARLSNAAAALDRSLAATTTGAGVDLLSFGGTKNGLLGAEAVVLLRPELAEGFEYLRKQSLQLASKMRFLSAQLHALLTGDLWLRNARHANAMATRLAGDLQDVEGVTVTKPVQSNAVFARLARPAIDALQAEFDFYMWDEQRDEVRWMCSWDTTEQDVDGFVSAIRGACASQ
jgi:threonine aldolase